MTLAFFHTHSGQSNSESDFTNREVWNECRVEGWRIPHKSEHNKTRKIERKKMEKGIN